MLFGHCPPNVFVIGIALYVEFVTFLLVGSRRDRRGQLRGFGLYQEPFLVGIVGEVELD
jgi:hypothetical protein